MQDSIWSVMWENTPTAAIIAQVAMLSGYLVFLAMKLYQRFQKVEDKSIDHADRIVTSEVTLESVEKRTTVLEAKLDSIENKLDFLQKQVSTLMTQVSSITSHLLSSQDKPVLPKP